MGNALFLPEEMREDFIPDPNQKLQQKGERNPRILSPPLLRLRCFQVITLRSSCSFPVIASTCPANGHQAVEENHAEHHAARPHLDGVGWAQCYMRKTAGDSGTCNDF